MFPKTGTSGAKNPSKNPSRISAPGSAKLQEGRWAAVSWPKEYAGRSATLMQQAIFWEEMARVEAPPMANSLGLGLIGPTIIAYGTEAQKTTLHSENLER